MAHVLRLLLGLSLVLGLAVGVAVWQPAWGEALGVDFWNLPAMTRLVQVEEQRSASIEAQMRVRAEEARRKEKVLLDLIDGRVNFAEAIDAVIRIGGQKLVEYDLPTACLGGDTVEEQVGRLLRHWANRRLAGDPTRLRHLHERLDRESAGYLVSARPAGVQ